MKAMLHPRLKSLALVAAGVPTISVLAFAVAFLASPDREFGVVAFTRFYASQAVSYLDWPTERGARIAAEKFTRQHLIAPRTAVFADPSETLIEKQPGRRYHVSGYVDSQNAFGALLRARYDCVVQFDRGIGWQLASWELHP